MRGLAIWVALWERCAPALIIQNTARKATRVPFSNFLPEKDSGYVSIRFAQANDSASIGLASNGNF